MPSSPSRSAAPHAVALSSLFSVYIQEVDGHKAEIEEHDALKASYRSHKRTRHKDLTRRLRGQPKERDRVRESTVLIAYEARNETRSYNMGFFLQ